MTTLNGRIDHITFHNTENHFTVARLVIAETRTPVTVVGHMPAPVAGENVQLTGQWRAHPKYGQQFKIQSVASRLPATAEEIKNYLRSGAIKGIGAATAENIVRKFGADTFAVIESAPEKLTDIDGIGKAKADAIHAQWQTMRAYREIMTYLQENGVSGAYAEKIFRLYGDEAIDIIRESPYQLTTSISGIGFAIADRIAINAGMASDAPERTQACIRHMLQEAASEGHVFLFEENLIDHAHRLYDMAPEDLREAVNALIDADAVAADETPETGSNRRIYPKALYDAETAIAARLSVLISLPLADLPVTADHLLARIQTSLLVDLTAEQINALEVIIANRVVVITGGPGTGKTTLVRSIAAVFKQIGSRICLAAPTGRAARRLSEVTGKPAHTIHKLLAYNFDDHFFGRNQDNPIDADIIIIDEASMVDAPLMYHLLNAVALSSRLVIVGDAFQLPPVGPGNILADLINSGMISVCHLTTIFRQAAESLITMNAHRVRNGELPELFALDDTTPLDSEFYLIEETDLETIANKICHLCAEVLPEHLNLDPFKSIQVLSPVHKGIVGTINLNQKLQSALNPGKNMLTGINHAFKPGDKVMNLKNNYQKEVYNGDIGTIIKIDPAGSLVSIDFYGRPVDYAMDELEDLTLGYAISVHKSQGSEYPVVILPLITRHYVMLQRNLLYTAITRAKSLVILIGSKKALSIALANNKPEMRLSGLSERLQVLANP